MVMNACCDFTQLFEGLKAFYGEDGKVRIFRPDMNCKRLNQSAEYACLPVSYVYPRVCLCVCMCLSMCVHADAVQRIKVLGTCLVIMYCIAGKFGGRGRIVADSPN